MVILAWLLYRSVFIWTTLSLSCAFFSSSFFTFYFNVLLLLFLVLSLVPFACVVTVSRTDRLPERHLCLNLYPCVLKLVSLSLPTSRRLQRQMFSIIVFRQFVAESIIEPQTTAYMSSNFYMISANQKLLTICHPISLLRRSNHMKGSK